MATGTRKAAARAGNPAPRPGKRPAVAPEGKPAQRPKPKAMPTPLTAGVHPKSKPLVNSKLNKHSYLTLEGMDFTGWGVAPTAPGSAGAANGVWAAHKAGKQPDLNTELRLVLRTDIAPHMRFTDTDPPDGTLAITLTNTPGGMPPTMTVPVDVDFVNE